VGVGVAAGFGRREVGVEDRKWEGGGASGSRKVERDGVRREGVGMGMFGHRHKGWESANGGIASGEQSSERMKSLKRMTGEAEAGGSNHGW
jgi:hypothetical protein